MTQRLKRWESPRREGRNDKGKGGSARQRQRRKQFQALRKKLKAQSDHQNHKRGSNDASPLFLADLQPFSFAFTTPHTVRLSAHAEALHPHSLDCGLPNQ